MGSLQEINTIYCCVSLEDERIEDQFPQEEWTAQDMLTLLSPFGSYVPGDEFYDYTAPSYLDYLNATRWEEDESDYVAIRVELTAWDYLDMIRYDAFDEFKINGIETNFDDVDSYQSRGRSLRPEHQETSDVCESNTELANYFLKRNKTQRRALCVFCRNNGENESVFLSHILKDCDGRVTCPVLRRYTCPICGKFGDEAHTIKYCPMNKKIPGWRQNFFDGQHEIQVAVGGKL